MNTVGLITEYNPFHKGHAYHIEKSKEMTRADFAIAVMSGDFVQRGTPALLPKHIRAEMALQNGADLVLELPVQYATGSAELFAHGAVSILNSLGVVTHLCFGSECGDHTRLMEIARILSDEPVWYRDTLQENLKKGLSYPAARAEALPQYRELLESPNNILGIEYCKAILRLKSDIKPLTLKREGNDYHETTLGTSFASASALREQLLAGAEPCTLADYIPEQSLEILSNGMEKYGYMSENDLSGLLVYRLMMLSSPAELYPYADMSEELAARIYKNRNEFHSFSQFADLLKTREVTRTRINRALLHLILNIKKGTDTVPYARVLGFRKNAAPMLNEIKQKAAFPLLTKTADYQKILTPEQQKSFLESTNASMLFEAVNAQKTGCSIKSEFTKQLVII